MIDPKSHGLSARTVVEAIDQNILAIVINHKSRIIMADGKNILEKSATIKEAKPGCQIMLKTTAPVCSKTLKFLADQGIKVIRDLNSIFAGISSYMTYNGNNAR